MEERNENFSFPGSQTEGEGKRAEQTHHFCGAGTEESPGRGVEGQDRERWGFRPADIGFASNWVGCNQMLSSVL